MTKTKVINLTDRKVLYRLGAKIKARIESGHEQPGDPKRLLNIIYRYLECYKSEGHATGDAPLFRELSNRNRRGK